MNTTQLTTVSITLVLILIITYPKTQFAQQAQRADEASGQIGRAGQTEAAQADQVVLEASFEKSMPAADIVKLLSSKQVRVEYLLYRWGEHTGWYVLADGESLDEAVKHFEQQHSDFLQKQLVNNTLELMSMNAAVPSKTRQQLQESQARLAQEFADQLADFRSNGLSLSGLAVKGNRAAMPVIREAFPKGKANYRTLEKSEDGLQAQTKNLVQVQASSGKPYPDAAWKFSPSSGVISYDKNSKYFTSRFTFTDVSGFNSTHSAYEHDITIWSLKDTYVRPGAGARYTNLPSPYIDTTVMDDYASFTIGTTAATQIKANLSYYIDVPVEVINSNGGPSSGSIQPQLGSWAGAYDEGEGSESAEKAFCAANLFAAAYCVFSDQTHTIKDYFTNSSPTSTRDFPFDHRISSSYTWKSQVAAPSITPGSLSSQSPVKASISSAMSGATIRYTTNGSDPTGTSTIYSGPLTFNSSVTLKARAFKSGMTDSSVSSATYSIVQPAATPAISALDYMSAPVADKRFIVRLKGVFDPVRVRVVVTGPGCQTFGACTVSNATLKDFGVVNASIIERVPLTLGAGAYQLYVQNGSSVRDPVSKGETISVLANDPAITKIIYLTTPLSGKEFTVQIDGQYFDPNLVRVVVTGPGCANFGSCVVSNGVLKNFGGVSSTRLAKVPLTLGVGNYQVYVQNGTSSARGVSSGYAITVNNPVVTLELTRLTLVTTPKPGKQFLSTLDGHGFDKNRIQVVVTGPGCSSFGTCVIPNKVIRDFGTVSDTRLSKVPMTLGVGTYKVYVQNGTSFRDPVSSAISLSVKK